MRETSEISYSTKYIYYVKFSEVFQWDFMVDYIFSLLGHSTML